ncbi:T9SS type A sorting domain-containing protein [Owenweeksia hongkongensis]|uniref:T9SS type A sorting domain-containing protein n=1 Tax=Owenweeksia hongkongensis TaxID=253245 RepID=UPI003A8EB788
MTTKTTRFAILMVMNALAFGAMAQITITRSDFPRGTTFTDNFATSAQTGFALPAEGPAQTWDFATGITADTLYARPRTDATADPDFPNALNKRNSPLIQGFLIQQELYEAIDANGWYEYGAKLQAADYSLQAVTGGPNDSIHFLALNDIYSGRTDYLQFPLNYQDAWTGMRKETIDFELTVSSSSLNRAPGSQITSVTFDREVVGYGTLQVPTANGSPSAPFDALMIKSIRTSVDSFYLGGMAAPPSLLAAFGLTQGQSEIYESYIWYRKDFGFPIGGLSIVNGQVGTFDYRTNATTVSLTEWTVSRSSVFPNPVAAGDNVTIEFDQEADGLMDFTLLDLTGRKVFQATGISSMHGVINTQLPKNLSEGQYFYQLKNKKESFITGGKLILK